MSRPWTPDDDATLLRLTREGRLQSEIGADLDRSLGAIKNRVRTLQGRGATIDRPKRFDPRYGDLFARLWNCPSISVDEIAAHFGVTRQAIVSARKVRGWPPREVIRGQRRASVEQRLSELWRAGVRRRDIARLCGLAASWQVTHWARRLELPPRVKSGGKGAIGGWPTVPAERAAEAIYAARLQEAARAA